MSGLWLNAEITARRLGLKGPRAAEALKQLGLTVPGKANSWAPLRAQDRDDSPNVIARLGHTEFFIEESGAAPGIEALEALLANGEPGVYPVLREDLALELGGGQAVDALAEVCNIEFAALPPAQRAVVMTLMTGVGVLVLPQPRDDGTVYRIWCDPSFGPRLRETLADLVGGEMANKNGRPT